MKTSTMIGIGIAAAAVYAYMQIRKTQSTSSRQQTANGEWVETVNVHTLPLWEQSHPQAVITSIRFGTTDTSIATVTYYDNSMSGLGDAWDAYLSQTGQANVHVNYPGGGSVDVGSDGYAKSQPQQHSPEFQAALDNVATKQQAAQNQAAVRATAAAAGGVPRAPNLNVQRPAAPAAPAGGMRNIPAGLTKNSKGQWVDPGGGAHHNSGILLTVPTTQTGLPAGGNPYNINPNINNSLRTRAAQGDMWRGGW